MSDNEDFDEIGFSSGDEFVEDDEDMFAQEEEKLRADQCCVCRAVVDPSVLVELSQCHHRFCNMCATHFFNEQVLNGETPHCPQAGCEKCLTSQEALLLEKRVATVRDGLKFLDEAKDREAARRGEESVATQRATKALQNELRRLAKSDPDANGFSVETVGDNIYTWDVRLFNFDPKDEQIARDMQARGIKDVLVRIVFPRDFPLSPPFCRIIRPRFAFLTGHITIGGAICMELLTPAGWFPECRLESVILTIRTELVDGNARIESAGPDYSEAEAKDAFVRLVSKHGWGKKR